MRNSIENRSRQFRFEHWQLISIALAVFDAMAVNDAFYIALWMRYDCQFADIPYFYLDAIRFNLKDDNFAVKAFDSVSEYVVTDMSIDQISDIAERVADYEYVGVQDIAGEARLGERYIEFYVDKDKLQQQIIELFYVPA